MMEGVPLKRYGYKVLLTEVRDGPFEEAAASSSLMMQIQML